MADLSERHRHFINVARDVSKYSKDPNKKVGAIITNEMGLVLGAGYNRFLKKVQVTEDRLNNKVVKLRFTVHAEVVAVMSCKVPPVDGILYVWPGIPPCSDCTKVVIEAGIKTIVGPRFTREESSWYESCMASKIMCEESGVELITVEMQNEAQ